MAVTEIAEAAVDAIKTGYLIIYICQSNKGNCHAGEIWHGSFFHISFW